MKLQGLSVIFTLVCIPLLLVLSYYISLQVDTITMQNEYDSKLISATYDAVSALELNTANEDLSSVSDSLRTIIEASNSIFFNTLATNMGLSNASKAYVEPYIPSVLYTLYDGYYIFAPTTIPVVKTDENGVALTVGQDYISYDDATGYTYLAENDFTDPQERDATWKSNINSVGNLVNPNNLEEYGQLLYVPNDGDVASNEGLITNPDEAKKQIKNVLKSYMPYSARYRASNKLLAKTTGETTAYPSNWTSLTYDFNIIYTLDNYMTVEGYVQNGDDATSQIYYTESGYLIKDDDDDDGDSTVVEIGGTSMVSGSYNQNQIQNIIENNSAEVVITIKNDGNDDTVLSTADLEDVDAIIDDYSDNYVLVGDEIPAGIDEESEEMVAAKNERLKFLTSNSDRWNEKSLKEKYEVFLTILKNRYTEIEETPSYVNQINHLNGLNKIINRTQYNLDLMNSIIYYAKAKTFTDWVKTHISMIQANDIVEISGMDFGTIQEGLRFGTRDYTESDDLRSDFQTLIDFRDDTTYLFSSSSFVANKDSSNLYNDSATEIGKDSNFNNHKLRVIRASIQYSLNLAMTTYNSNESYGILAQGEIRRGDNSKKSGYAMPVLQYEEWEKITENPSVVAFMQGLKCGLKIYNNYAVVSSTNNELTVRPENVYYVVDKDDAYESFNGGYLNPTDCYYHRIDCKALYKSLVAEKRIFAFSSKEAKYDKIYDKMATRAKYKYDHKNLACYTCVNDGNYSEEKVNIFDNYTDDKFAVLRKAFYLGLGKERNNVYKMNAFRDSYGSQRLYRNMVGVDPNAVIQGQGNYKLDQFRALKITFSYVSGEGENSVTFKAGIGNNGTITQYCSDDQYSIPANTAQLYTVTIDCNNLNVDTTLLTGTSIYDYIQFETNTHNTTVENNLKNAIRFIEAVYK